MAEGEVGPVGGIRKYTNRISTAAEQAPQRNDRIFLNCSSNVISSSVTTSKAPIQERSNEALSRSCIAHGTYLRLSKTAMEGERSVCRLISNSITISTYRATY